jgi:hypothetical protein
MDLTPEQKAAVAEWIASGASIADVQKRLREEHNVSLTFMDTRFLIDDLNLDLVVPDPPQPPAADLAAEKSPAGMPESDLDDAPVDSDAGSAGSGNVRVDVDRLTRPGTVVSGTVTFSDGKSGKWGLDQMGRLVFEAPEEGYRPTDADLQEFQKELSLQLQKKGF